LYYSRISVKIKSIIYSITIFDIYARRKNMKKVYLVITITALALVTGLLLIIFTSKPESEDKTELYTTGDFNDMSAEELAANIRIGWNLGNTLDTTGLNWLNRSDAVSRFETAWGNPLTTGETIDAVKNAGFNAIRFPVSWAKCVDSNYNIRADWMSRVKQVVDFAAANDMYIIINTHHDEEIFKFLDKDMEESKRALKRIWEQIAEAFKDYNEKLIFEDLNEPRTTGSPNEWNGGTPEERNNLNILHQLFVDTVRASGGNNEKRILMVSTYAASSTAAAMNGLLIPNDPVNTENKIIVSIHAYEPYNFALNENSPVNTWSSDNPADTAPIIERIERAYNLFVSKGFPVIMGEFGALNKNNEEARAAWAQYYVSYAMGRGVKCFWWDNGGDFILLNRTAKFFYYPLIVEALMRGSE
jgi:endoglucanase